FNVRRDPPHFVTTNRRPAPRPTVGVVSHAAAKVQIHVFHRAVCSYFGEVAPLIRGGLGASVRRSPRKRRLYVRNHERPGACIVGTRRPQHAAGGCLAWPRRNRRRASPMTSKSGNESVSLTGPVVSQAGTAGHLPAGHALREFQVERVLGEGGFSVVYLAT